jgi:hypothetical protein
VTVSSLRELEWRRRGVTATVVVTLFVAVGVTGWLAHWPPIGPGNATQPSLAWAAAQAPLPRDAAVGSGQSAGLNHVACPAVGSCVAVGYYEASSNGGELMKPLIETFSGGKWTASSGVAGVPVSELKGIACPRQGSCVAVGYYSTGSSASPVVATLSSGTWTATSLPQPRGADRSSLHEDIWDVECTAPGACIATGSFDDQKGNSNALIETLAGGTWTALRAPLPANAAPSPHAILYRTVCPAVTWCTAIGFYWANNGNGGLLIETLAGGTWTPQAAPLPADVRAGVLGNSLHDIACQAPRNCLVVGGYTTRGGQQENLAETLSGGTWTVATPPTPANAAVSLKALSLFFGLETVACRAPNSCVALGDYSVRDEVIDSLIDTLSGGTWTTAKAPLPSGAASPNLDLNFQFSSAACPAPDSCIAVGYYTTKNNVEQGLIETAAGKQG